VIHARQDTPEMRAVFEEVRASLAEVMARGEAPRWTPTSWPPPASGLAREVGETMLRRRPPTSRGRTDFAVRMILGGLPALPRLPVGDAPERVQRPARRAEDGAGAARPDAQGDVGGAPVEIAGRTLDPRLQFIAHQAKDGPSMISMSPAEARDASVRRAGDGVGPA
jgi:hypothetical protein